MTDMANCTPAQIARSNQTGLRRILPLLPLYLLIFIGFCGYSLMITLFAPMLMGNNGFLPDGATVGHRSIILGLLLAIYPLGQFVGSPILGALSDRYGRKPVLINSLVVTVFGYAVIALGIEWRSLVLLGMGCLIGGLAESNIAIAQSAISDMSSPDERPRLFAWTYSSSSLGYIAGPILGGQMAVHLGWSVPFWLIVPLLVTTLIWTWFRFAETHEADPQADFSMLAAMTNLSSVFTDKSIRRLYLLNFLIYLALFGYFRMVLVYLVDRWDTGVDQTTLIYSGLALISAITSFFIMAPLSRRIGLNRLAITACIAAGAAMIAITVPSQIGSIWITGGLTTMMGTIALAACPTILSNAVSLERQGRVMGNNQALQVGAESLSAMIGGALAAVTIPLPLVAFGIFLIICGGLLLRDFAA
jgi:DHA1 family tetracycline resistance protein-like MFS transporter